MKLVPFVERLRPTTRERLSQAGVRREVDAGEFVVHDGADAAAVFVVHDGLLKVVKSSLDGDVSFIGLCRPGTLVGELAVLTGAHRSSAVQSITDSEITVIRGEDFWTLLGELPDLGHELLVELAANLSETTVRLHALMNADALTRLADRLLRLADDFGAVNRGGMNIDLPVSQEELGDWAGLSRAATVKALHELRERGLIATGRMRISVLDLDGLCDVAAV